MVSMQNGMGVKLFQYTFLIDTLVPISLNSLSPLNPENKEHHRH